MKCKNDNIPLTACFSIVKQQYLIYLNKSLEKEEETVSAGQCGFLVYLLFNEKSCQEEIAKHYKLDKGVVARGIRKLENQNLINKETDENNRRKCCLSLNEDGKRIAKKIIEINKEWEKEIYSNIDNSKEEIDTILNQITINTIKINKEMEDSDG